MENRYRKKSTVLLFVAMFAVMLCATESATGYGMQFPQQKNYPGLTKPKAQTLMNRAVVNQYENYKSKYLIESDEVNGGYYILSTATDGSSHIITVSEAHGWGMTIMAYMAGADTTESGQDMAKVYFDGMVKFWQAHKSGGLMNWRVYAGEWSQATDGAATDGDLDIANAFILAHQQWGDASYLQHARTIISDIQSYEMNYAKKLPTIGNFGVAPQATRPSDWLGCNFRNFAQVSDASFWNGAAEAIYNEYDRFVSANSPATGLVSDFIDDGRICSEWFLSEFKYTNSFNTNACRVPFRFAYDYLLYGSNDAKNALVKMCTWASDASGGQAANLKSGYWVDDGTVIKEGSTIGVDDFDYNSMYFIGSFLAGASTVPSLNSFAEDLFVECGKDYSLDNADAFGDAIYLLSLVLISGNAWKYGDLDTYVDPGEVDTAGVIFDHFSNVYGDQNVQTAIGAAYGVAQVAHDKYGQGGCFWYAYGDQHGSTVKNADGEQIDENNFNLAVVTHTDSSDNYLNLALDNVRADEANSINPFTGFGAYFRQDVHADDTAQFDTRYVDLSKMKKLVIRAKGTGSIKVMLITEAFDLLPESDQWGHFQVELNLDSEMKDHIFDRDEFEPNAYNDAAKTINWSDAVTKVKALHFEHATPNSECEIFIDEVRLTGMEYEDFGFSYVDPEDITVSVVAPEGNKKMSNVALSYSNAEKKLGLTLPLKSGSVKMELYNVQGRVVRSLPLAVDNHTASVKFENISSGVYFMKLNVNGAVFNKKLTL